MANNTRKRNTMSNEAAQLQKDTLSLLPAARSRDERAIVALWNMYLPYMRHTHDHSILGLFKSGNKSIKDKFDNRAGYIYEYAFLKAIDNYESDKASFKTYLTNLVNYRLKDLYRQVYTHNGKFIKTKSYNINDMEYNAAFAAYDDELDVLIDPKQDRDDNQDEYDIGFADRKAQLSAEYDETCDGDECVEEKATLDDDAAFYAEEATRNIDLDGNWRYSRRALERIIAIYPKGDNKRRLLEEFLRVADKDDNFPRMKIVALKLGVSRQSIYGYLDTIRKDMEKQGISLDELK